MGNNEPLYLGAYWGDRREDLDACTERLMNFLLKLGACDGVFEQWFETGWSREEALSRKVAIERADLRKLVYKGRHLTDIGSKLMEDLGFSIFLWNGCPEDNGEMGFNVNCGSYTGNPGLVNNCVINLPRRGAAAERILSVKSLERLMSVVVEAWEPDWAVITLHALREGFKVRPRSPVFGWLLFLSARRGVVPALPAPSRTVQLEGLGILVITTDEQFDMERTDHIHAVKKTYRVLKKAGLLGPIPQVTECIGLT